MFLRPDPAMDGLNHYAYSSCNPVMYSDPTGLDAWYNWYIIFTAITTATGATTSFNSTLTVGGAIPVGTASSGSLSSGWEEGWYFGDELYYGEITALQGSGTQGNENNSTDNSLNASVDQAGAGTENERGVEQVIIDEKNFTGVRVTRNYYDGFEVTSKWVSKDGKTLYYGNKIINDKGEEIFTEKTGVYFKDKIEIIKNGKVIYLAQINSTPDLLDHPSGLKPYRVLEGYYKNIGLIGVNSPRYGIVAKVFPEYIYIHEKTGNSGLPYSLGCFVTYNNSDLPKIYNAISQISNQSGQFDLWIR